MKQCPRCKQTYSDDQLNFCLEDGEMLTAFSTEPPPNRYVDDSPPTVMLGDRVTSPTNWPQTPTSAPPAQWQGEQKMAAPFAAMPFQQRKDQTMPTIALIMGIASMVLICCYGGIWLGLPAAVVGYLGMRNSDSDPGRYGGRGLAIGGMVLGVISFLGSLVFAFIAIVSK